MVHHILLKIEISKDLALRDIANQFFDKIEKLEDKYIEIDFSNICSITRSFAHQYIFRKRQSNKIINEKNVPIYIQKMFNIVQNKNDKPKLLDIDNMEVVNIS